MRLVASMLGSAAIAAVFSAQAAELPTMKSARPEHVRACNVGGMAGVLVAGSAMCVKISGYVSGGVEAGAAKQQFNGAGQSHN